MKPVLVLFGFLHFFMFLKAQERISCDSLAKLFSKKWENQLIAKVDEGTIIKKINKCILKKRIEVDLDILSNLTYLKTTLSDDHLRRKMTMLLIKMHPFLDTNWKYANEQRLIWGLKPGDINFGSRKFLIKIKRNFGIDTYFKVLMKLNIKLKDNEKKFLQENFEKDETSSEREWKTEKWKTAIVLAKLGDLEAENYLIQLTRKVTRPEENRPLIHELGRDLVLTRNRNIINFFIDDFLMSDYSWSSFDTGHDDYEAALSLLRMVVDEEQIFYDSLIRTDGKSFIRQWFKDHRETYKIKP